MELYDRFYGDAEAIERRLVGFTALQIELAKLEAGF